MPSPNNLIPVYGAGRKLLQYAPVAAVERWLKDGRVIPRGTKHRVRSVIAVHDNFDLICSAFPPTNQRYSAKHETSDNPRNVWTHKFRKIRQ